MNDPREAGKSGFVNLDATPSAMPFIEYLRGVRAVDSIAAYKKRAAELLDVGPGVSVLDVGCGTGEDLIDILKLQPHVGRLVGVDNSRQMLASAKETLESNGLNPYRIDLEYADAHSLRFSDNTFGRVRTDRTLQHLKSPSTAIGEMTRVARPGGKILIIDTDWNSLQIDGLGDSANEAIRKAYHEIIQNPDMGTGIRELLVGWPVEQVKEEIFPINLKNKDAIETALWLTESLRKASQARFVDVDAIIDADDKFRDEQTQATGSFNIHLVTAVKTNS